jgi:hypothetical protein
LPIRSRVCEQIEEDLTLRHKDHKGAKGRGRKPHAENAEVQRKERRLDGAQCLKLSCEAETFYSTPMPKSIYFIS